MWPEDNLSQHFIIIQDLLEFSALHCMQKRNPRGDFTQKSTPRKQGMLAAAAQGDVETIEQLLIQNPQSIEERDPSLRSALHLAAQNGHDRLVQRLLELGSSLHEKDLGGWTALLFATERGHYSVVDRLLRLDTVEEQVMATPDGLTGLHLAAIRGHATVLALFLAHQSFSGIIAARDSSGRTALQFAADFGHAEIVSMLLRNTVSSVLLLDINGYSALHFAARSGHDGIVAELLAHSPELLDIKSFINGTSAVHLAAQSGHDHIVARFLALSPALVGTITDDGYTLLHFAAEHGHDQIVERLLSLRPGLLDVHTNRGSTALQLGAGAGRDKVVEQLLARSPAVVDAECCWQAFKNEFDLQQVEKVLRLLLAHKPELANCIDDRTKNTFLHHALGGAFQLGEDFSAEFMRQIFEMDPSAVHVVNLDGETPFMLAVASENDFGIELVQCKLSLDHIISAFAQHDRDPLNRAFFDKHCGEVLLRALNADLIGTVYGYLGLISSNKRQRSDDSDNDE